MSPSKSGRTDRPDTVSLSRREREIMDLLYRAGSATAAEVRSALSDPPSYSAVRAMLRILERKGHVRHEEEGRTYVFHPVARKDAARRNALQHLLHTFFDNSADQAVAALLALKGEKATEAELARMATLIELAKRSAARSIASDGDRLRVLEAAGATTTIEQ